MTTLLFTAALSLLGSHDLGSGAFQGGLLTRQEAPEYSTHQEKREQHRFIPERVFQLDKLQRVTCTVGENKFKLWVMDSSSKRNEGMMHIKKEDFKDDEGMIFVFSNEGDIVRRFWMRNTLVKLDICYCDKDGTINSTYTMNALDETTDYSSKRLSMYVIELRDGTLKKLRITEGMKFVIPEDVVSRDDQH